MDLQQTLILPFFRFRRTKLLCDLHIELFILPNSHKVDLAAAGFTDIDGISSAAKLQVYDILKTGCHTVRVIAENAVFTGKKLTVKDNYTIANTDFRIKISSNFDSPQLQDASSVDLSTDTIITGSDVIAVYYKAADSYARGDAYFKITPMKDQTKDIDEIAKEKANPVDAENNNLTKELTETTFGEVWPELTDSTVKSLKLYKITIVIKDNTFTAETYYFNINGRNYSAAVLYPYGDDDARKDLLNQFYNIEFIYAE